MFDRCAVGHLPFSKKMYLPLVGNGAHSSEHSEQSSFAGEWSPTMRSMFPPLVGSARQTIVQGSPGDYQR